MIKRKWLVTMLYECETCGLRFRFPKDRPQGASKFYEQDYEAGFTTAMPGPEALRELLATGFGGHEKDYSSYIGVLAAAGVEPPARILDFGASWGYGSWQFQRAGYEVVAYDVSARRARFAAAELGIRVIDDPGSPPDPVDCFFSAHVIEHLPDPDLLWRTARAALKPHGVFAAFMPNGNPAREPEASPEYHRLWGQAHPLLITPRYLLSAAARHGFEGAVYSSPYPIGRVRARQIGELLTGSELAIVGWRTDGH